MQNRFSKVLFALLLTGSACTLFAQSYDTTKLWSVHLGVSIPAGDFGRTAIAPSSSGFANTGFSFSVDTRSHLYSWVNGLTTLGFAKNTLNTSKYQHSLTTGLFAQNNVSAKGYTSLWLLYGPEVRTDWEDFDFSCSVQAGVIISSMPEINIQSDTNALNISAPFAPGLAYAASAGVRYDDYELTLRYMYGAPTYRITYLLNTETLENKVFMPTVLFQISLGYYF